MRRSAGRILTSHAGSLPQPAEVRQLLLQVTKGEPVDAELVAMRVDEAVRESVQQQIALGIDLVNDGEQGKVGFGAYVASRLGGVEWRGESKTSRRPSSRDFKRFPDYYSRSPQPRPTFAAMAPLSYAGTDDMRSDIERLKRAIPAGATVEGFVSAISPANLEHWIDNEHYRSQEDFLFALAEAMHEEFKIIADSSFTLQIDNPDVLNGYGIEQDLSVAEWRKYQELRVESINRALRGIPKNQVRMHVCWGAFHGPHSSDIPLREMIDLIYKFNVGCLSIEASNPAHQHEWTVFKEFPLPDGVVLMPGVIGHDSDTIEHPELVAERLQKYAEVVGRENVIAGTDCGYGAGRVGHPTVAWAKLKAMVDGARIASKRLWS